LTEQHLSETKEEFARLACILFSFLTKPKSSTAMREENMMYEKLAKMLILSLMLAGATGCSDDDPANPVSPSNHNPLVSRVAVVPSTVSAGEQAIVSCEASDPDGDALSYSWSSSAGQISGSGSIVTWTAPQITGDYSISCTVSDGHGGEDQLSCVAHCIADSTSSENRICYDLNDNQVPAGWTQELMFGGPGVSNGRFRGNTVDGRAWLKRSESLSSQYAGIRFEYEAEISYSYFGLSNGVAAVFGGSDTLKVGHTYADYNFPGKTRVGLGSENYYIAAEDGIYHYTVEFQDSQIYYKAIRASDGSVLFDYSEFVTGIDIQELTEIWFVVHTTTDNDSWMDNLCVGKF
jgi:hypothetical protein